jgi:hypothetical protein
MSGTGTLPRRNRPVDVGRRHVHIGLLDALVTTGLGVVAFVVRLHVPGDGLFYDDAWQAFGAWKGSFSEVISVGVTQPGFTAGLMVWTRLFGMSTASLVTPALVAGTLGPPALYVAMRWLGISRSVALLAGAALSSAPVHIEYSYHVKTYTFDVLILLGLALAIWKLAPLHWSTRTGVGWFVGSVAIGSFSSIALIAACVAGLVLVQHPSDDRRLRIVVVAAQVAVLAALFVASSRTYNASRIRGFFAPRGGYIDFGPNPLTFAREVLSHFWHLADVFPGGLPALALVLAAVGLVVAAWRGPIAVPARFLGVMVLVAAGGSVVKAIPFGPPRAVGRVSLWLVPAMAVGLCTTLELMRRRTAARVALRTAFDTIVCIAAVLALVGSLGTDHRYAAAGRAASRRVMSLAGPHDSVLVTIPTMYSFALYAPTPVDLRLTPDRQVGFLPTFSDPRLHLLADFTFTPEQIDAFVDGAERVYVVQADADPRGNAQYNFRLGVALTLRGFELESSTKLDTGQIDAWHRKADGSRLRAPERAS